MTGQAAGWGWPVVLKAVSGGYDGRGVWVCQTPAEAAAVLAHPVGVFAEEHVGFDAELAAVVARSPHGQAAAYPVVQTIQRDGVCHEVLAPAPGLGRRCARAQRIALELPPSSAWSGCSPWSCSARRRWAPGQRAGDAAAQQRPLDHRRRRTSQFEQHLRAVLDLPLGDPRAARPCVVMANVLGGTDPDVYARYTHVMAADPGAKVHLYGKAVRPGRKIGHVTVLGDDMPACAPRRPRRRLPGHGRGVIG